MTSEYCPNSIANKALKINRRCVRCGKEAVGHRGRNWTIDHFIPYAVAKWAPLVDESLDTEKLTEELNILENTVVMCPLCNFDKGARVVAPHELKEFRYLTPKQSSDFEKTYKKLKYAIQCYKNMLSTLLKKQKEKCYTCGKFVPKSFAVIRRIDGNKERSMENACVLCNNCSRTLAHRKNDEVLRKGMFKDRHKTVWSAVHN